MWDVGCAALVDGVNGRGGDWAMGPGGGAAAGGRGEGLGAGGGEEVGE